MPKCDKLGYDICTPLVSIQRFLLALFPLAYKQEVACSYLLALLEQFGMNEWIARFCMCA
jgi:hypothetical protein